MHSGDAENSATIGLSGLSLPPQSCYDTVLSVHRPIHGTDRRYSRDARADVEVAYAKPLSLVPSEKGRWVLHQLSENFANETVSQV